MSTILENDVEYLEFQYKKYLEHVANIDHDLGIMYQNCTNLWKTENSA